MQLKNLIKKLFLKFVNSISIIKSLLRQTNGQAVFFKKSNYNPINPVRFDNELGQIAQNYLPLSNQLSLISIFCEMLLKKNYKFSTMRNLQSQPNDQLTVSIRHDVDAHPPTALAMAKIYASYSLPTSFYFLHSAAYYIQISENKIYRNPEIENWCTKIALYGCEVGLHNDVLFLANKLKIPAFDILSEELSFLRGIGLTIDGTVAHNSFPVHGAENFEVFKELQTFESKFYTKDQIRKIEKIRSKYEISTVNMNDLGLNYEGNFPKTPDYRSQDDFENFCFSKDTGLSNKNWMNIYLNHHPSIERDYGADIWLIGKNLWIISDRQLRFYKHGCGIKDVKEYLELQNKSSKLVVTIHPEYFIQIP
jgi:hypothetical protein